MNGKAMYTVRVKRGRPKLQRGSGNKPMSTIPTAPLQIEMAEVDEELSMLDDEEATSPNLPSIIATSLRHTYKSIPLADITAQVANILAKMKV